LITVWLICILLMCDFVRGNDVIVTTTSLTQTEVNTITSADNALSFNANTYTFSAGVLSSLINYSI